MDVNASLACEDRTSLWSDALDLSASEADLPRALQAEAKTMFSTTPEAMQQWQVMDTVSFVGSQRQRF